jgi:antitoxin component of RelBE/YafQ-DinJ toxin-antitoxin module
MTTTIKINIDYSTKQKAERALNLIGFDLEEAIKLFLKDVSKRGKSFKDQDTSGKYKSEVIRELISEFNNKNTHHGPFHSAKDLLNDALLPRFTFDLCQRTNYNQTYHT